MSEKRAQQTRRELQAAGLVEFAPPKGRGGTARYRLTVAKAERNDAPPKEATEPQEATEGGAYVAPPKSGKSTPQVHQNDGTAPCKAERLSPDGGASLDRKAERDDAHPGLYGLKNRSKEPRAPPRDPLAFEITDSTHN